MHASSTQLTPSDFKRLINSWTGCDETCVQLSKKRLGEDYEEYFKSSSDFESDANRRYDKELAKSLSSDVSKMERCWVRVFASSNLTKNGDVIKPLKIETVTTPDDKEVVGWFIVSE